MELIRFDKVKDGKYLKNYELTYLNRAGKEKVYEIVSRKEIEDISQLGNRVNGVSIVATWRGKLLLLKEFRMGVNKSIYNLCAGMLEEGETLEACIERELFEETGLHCKRIKKILPPSYAAVAISDVKTQIAFVEAEGEIKEQGSDNEEIKAAFYTRKEVEALLDHAEFSSRAQIAAYMFCCHKRQEQYEQALTYAAKKHAGQLRVGGLPYITHPVAVAETIRQKGGDIETQMVALFHDLLEDTDATEAEILEIGGEEVLEAVKRLTKREGYVMAEYVEGIRNNPMAFAVKGADRLHNLQCAVDRSEEFKRHYIEETQTWYLDFMPEIKDALLALQNGI